MIAYTVSASSPFADFATGLDQLASREINKSLVASTIKEARYHEGQAAAYRHAAEMARATTIRAEDIGEGLSSQIK